MDDATPLTFSAVAAEDGLDDWRMMFQTLETRYDTGTFAVGLDLATRVGAAAEELGEDTADGPDVNCVDLLALSGGGKLVGH